MKLRHMIIAAIFILPMFIMLDGLVYRAQPSKNNNKIRPALQFILDNYRPGDIVYNVSEGSWVGLVAYLPADMPQYVMPDCGHSIGGLTLQTQQALGVPFMTVEALQQIKGRAWVIFGNSALSAPCDVLVMDPIIGGREPAMMLEDMVLSKIGIWLYEP